MKPFTFKINNSLLTLFQLIIFVHLNSIGISLARSDWLYLQTHDDPSFSSTTSFTYQNASLSNLAESSTLANVHQPAFIENLKLHIKQVLNLELDNKTLDEYITQSFNIYNADPLYVFILPEDVQNKTIILRKSNFAEAIFPNVTALQKLRKIAMQTRFIQTESLRDKQDEKLWKIDNYFKEKYEKFKLNAFDLGEAENLKIIEENVRTERSFMKFMDDLNNNRLENEVNDSEGVGSSQVHSLTERSYNDFGKWNKLGHDKNKPYKLTTNKGEIQWIRQTTTSRPNRPQTWNNQNWPGVIKPSSDEIRRNGTPVHLPVKTSHLIGIRDRFLPILANFDSLLFLTTTTTTPKTTTPDHHPHTDKNKHSFSYSFVTHYPPSHSQIQFSTTPSSFPAIDLFSPNPAYLANPSATEDPAVFRNIKETWDVKFEVPNEIRNVLKQERDKLENITHTLSFGSKQSKWPVTKSRAAHKDSDVFIARVNNPFGHSTKWKWSNSTVSQSEADGNDVEGRQKRGVLELYSMVKCATGCDPLLYKGYGCYCGFLGRGRALDGIDRCCKMHDYCYTAANCPKYLEYFVPYLWKCYKGRPLCAVDHGEWGGPGSCASMLCECDRALSKCLRRFYCPRKRAICVSSPLRLLQNIIMDL